MLKLLWRTKITDDYKEVLVNSAEEARILVTQKGIERDGRLVELFTIVSTSRIPHVTPSFIQLDVWWPVITDIKLGEQLLDKAGEPEMVNHPAHYQSESGLEVVDAVEAFTPSDPHKAQALIYICRAERKGNEVEDLRKAIWWLKRRLYVLEALEKDKVSA